MTIKQAVEKYTKVNHDIKEISTLSAYILFNSEGHVELTEDSKYSKVSNDDLFKIQDYLEDYKKILITSLNEEFKVEAPENDN